ncbi:MAG TPA: ATP-binding protein [Clostridia bacterium]|nr:ATP-binding protein [Clostridia bacterium]
MRSVFFRRLVLAFAIAMLIAAIVMFGGYVFLSRDVYTEIKLDELQPSVDAACQLAYEYLAHNVDSDTFFRLAGKTMSPENGAALFVGADGAVVYYTDSLFHVDENTLAYYLRNQIGAVLSGQSVRLDRLNVPSGLSVLAVGAPVTDEAGNVLGAIILVKSVKIITGTTTRMSVIFLWMAAFAIPLGMISAAWRVKTVTEPINRMSEAAMEMTKGNFNIRVEDEEAGEIGELARALNNLGSELSKTIRQLSSEKGQLDQILQSLTDGVAATDEAGRLTHYNTALMRIFGAVSVARREDLISDEKIWQEFDAVYDAGEARTITYPMPGDRVLWITISPVTAENCEKVGVVALFRDMTEMERLESMRREYVANVSHELRTPLTALRGLLEPLADDMVRRKEDQQRYYKIMLHEVMRLSRLITDMMTLSRLQSGTEYMELVRVDLYGLVNDIAGGYSSTVSNKGVQLVVDCPHPVPDCMTDPDRIEQVVVILLDNAVRYTPEGGTITIRLRNRQKHVELTVEDTGCGIPEKDLPHIFERFYKVDKSRNEGGTGLGLSIAQFIMDKLGESISVESEVDKGTRFTLTVKHYVKNAIALGPAGEKSSRYGDEVVEHALPEDSDRPESRKDVLDAHYEVIKPTKKQ